MGDLFNCSKLVNYVVVVVEVVVFVLIAATRIELVGVTILIKLLVWEVVGIASNQQSVDKIHSCMRNARWEIERLLTTRKLFDSFEAQIFIHRCERRPAYMYVCMYVCMYV
jgi:hypothetical protein